MGKKAELAKVLEQLLSGEVDLSEVRAQIKTLEEKHDSAVERIDKIEGNQPVLTVKINDAPELELSVPASPHLRRLIINAKNGLYTLLVGPAGCGKTTLARQLSEALGLPFGEVCFTAGASEAWLFGRQTPTGFIEGPFSKLYREGGVFLADEMDAADANLLLAINTALSHDRMLNPMNGEYIDKHKDFVFVGAANSNGKGGNHLYTGRSRLDAATLDRMVLVLVDYNEDLEKKLCPHEALYNLLTSLRVQLRTEKQDEFVSTRAYINCFKQLVAGISLDDIMGSLGANWSDSARETLTNAVRAHAQHFLSQEPIKDENPPKVKRGPGRPRKNAAPAIILDDQIESSKFAFKMMRKAGQIKVKNDDEWELLK